MKSYKPCNVELKQQSILYCARSKTAGDTVKFIRGAQNFAHIQVPTVVTIGAFDGMHLGHQCVLQQLLTQAQARNAASVVILFEPQPKEYFAGEYAEPRVMALRDKIRFLQEQGVDYVVCLRFTRSFAKLSAETFIQQILVDGLQCQHLIVGDDFRFGFQRKGDFAMLQAEPSFTVEDTQTHTINGRRVSSSWVRDCLLRGDFTAAETLLGRPYALTGKVQHGMKLGRQLGFPTINLKLPRPMVVQGVYHVRVSGLGDQVITGAANVGTRPAVGGTRPLLEVYLLDYDGDCYGQLVQVAFVQKLREEEDFPDLETLVAQMHQDVEQVRSNCGESFG